MAVSIRILHNHPVVSRSRNRCLNLVHGLPVGGDLSESLVANELCLASVDWPLAPGQSAALDDGRPDSHIAVFIELDVNDIGVTADRAIFDVLLVGPRRFVDRYNNLFAAGSADVYSLFGFHFEYVPRTRTAKRSTRLNASEASEPVPSSPIRGATIALAMVIRATLIAGICRIKSEATIVPVSMRFSTFWRNFWSWHGLEQ
jgi:hypothetical protein